MTRFLVDIKEEKLKIIDEISDNKRISRAELVRRALDLLIQIEYKKKEKEVFGVLSGKKKIDGLKLQQQLRDEW